MKNPIQSSVRYLCVVFLALSFQLDAQNFWQQMNGPYGDAITAIASKGNGLLFCGTRQSGIYKSIDDGATWTKTGTMSNPKVLALLILPGGDILVGSHGNGFLKSTNNGDSWSEIGNMITPAITTSIVNQSSTNIVAGTYGGIFSSSNGGGFWWNAKSGIGNNSILCLALNASGHIFAGCLDSGIFRSTNNGKNWTRIIGGLPPVSVTAMAFHTGGSIFAGTEGAGIYKSSDNGNSWTQLNIGSQYRTVTTITTSSTGEIFASLNYGVIHSTDVGNTWSTLSSDLDNNTMMSFFISTSNVLLAGSWSGNMFRSIDNGSSWTKMNLFSITSPFRALYYNNNMLYAGAADDGVFISSDNGTSWKHFQLTNIRHNFLTVKCITVTKSGYILVGTEIYGIFRSTDGGFNWSKTNTGLANLYTYELVSNANGDVVVGTGGGGVFRSTNEGLTWQDANFGLTNNVILSLSMKQTGQLFAGTANGGVFLSTDFGTFWTEVNNGLTNKFANSITIHPNGYLFVGTSGEGIFRSTNNESSWLKVLPVVTTSPVMDIKINSIGYLYAGTTGAGVYRSRDDANTWSQVNTGLVNKNINALALNAGGYLYAATDVGIYQTVAPTTATAPSIALSVTQLNFGTVAVNGSANKQFDITNNGDADLVINSISITSNTDFSTTFTTPTTISAGLKKTVVVSFKPKSAGAQAATLTIQSNDQTNPTKTVNLSGSGTLVPKPHIVVNITQIDFGSVVLPATTRKYLVIENQGNASLAVSNVQLSGANASDFTTTVTLPMTIAASSRDSVAIDFAPKAKGTSIAQLQITHNDADQSSIAVSLTGNSLNPGKISVNQTSIDFGTLNENDPPVSRSVVVQNSGDVVLNISNQQITGTNKSDFQIVKTITSLLDAQASDSIIVRFAPVAGYTGDKSATLSIESGSAPSTKTDISLSAKVVSSVGVEKLSPTNFSLSQNYPNPFYTNTSISFSLPKSSHVTLKIFNALGQEMQRVIDGVRFDAGMHEVEVKIDAKKNEMLFYQIITSDFVETKKMLLLQ